MTTSGGIFTVVDDDEVAHVVNFDAAPASRRVRQAVLVLQAVDELTDEPVRQVGVSTQTPGMSTATAGSGYAGLVAVPDDVFPNLANQSYPVDITLQVPGYTAWTTTRQILAQNHPSTFTALDLGVVKLRRQPVRIGVTTVALSAQNKPEALGGVTVRLTKVWRRLADLGGPGSDVGMISVPLGVSQRWPVGTALDSVSLLGPAEPPRRLARGAVPGQRSLDVDVLGALVTGDLVGLDTSDVSRREYLPVTEVGTTDTDSPATLQTAGPVRIAHARLASARRVPAPPDAPADATVTDGTEPGDTTVFVDTVAPFAPVEILRASGVALTEEYLDGHLFQVTTDGTGTARLPALSRVAAVEIDASKGALSATVRFTPDYSSPTNSVVLTLR